jgi:hypothetical protein
MKGGVRFGNRSSGKRAQILVCPEAGTGDPLTGFRYYCQQYRFFPNGEQKIF